MVDRVGLSLERFELVYRYFRFPQSSLDINKLVSGSALFNDVVRTLIANIRPLVTAYFLLHRVPIDPDAIVMC